MLEMLKKSLEEAPVMKRGEYSYFIHPLTDAIPRIQPELLDEVAEAIIENSEMDVDTILTMEAMGIHIAAAISLKTGLPFNIIRKREYGLPGEVVLDQSTGYSKGKMYINDIRKGDKVTIVDAVISTGGTLNAVIKGLERIGAEIKDIICVIERGDGVKKVMKETGYKVKTLVKIEVDGNVKIVKSIG
ncbi:MAG: hypoxanthine/guanine phosphoribosyltransferase [Candidatus Altiarchaeota archaeon]